MLPPSELATLAPELEALILRMLSEEPEARGTAGELAEALEQAAEEAGPVVDERVVPSRSMLPTDRATRPGPTRWHLARQALRRVAREHSAAMCVTGTLAAVLLVMLPLTPLPEKPAQVVLAKEEHTAGLADAGVDDSVLASMEVNLYGVPGFVLGEPMPKRPEPGWKRPPCSGTQRSINGTCWFGPLEGEKPPCSDSYEHDGRCYTPVNLKGRRQPTSDEP